MHINIFLLNHCLDWLISTYYQYKVKYFILLIRLFNLLGAA